MSCRALATLPLDTSSMPAGDIIYRPPWLPKYHTRPPGSLHQGRPNEIPVWSVIRSSWPPARGSPVILHMLLSPPIMQRSSLYGMIVLTTSGMPPALLFLAEMASWALGFCGKLSQLFGSNTLLMCHADGSSGSRPSTRRPRHVSTRRQRGGIDPRSSLSQSSHSSLGRRCGMTFHPL